MVLREGSIHHYTLRLRRRCSHDSLVLVYLFVTPKYQVLNFCTDLFSDSFSPELSPEVSL